MSPEEPTFRQLLETSVTAVLALGGLPVLIVMVRRLRAHGVGLPTSGAWPAVTWGRRESGMIFVLGLFVVQCVFHMVVQQAAAYLAGPAMVRLDVPLSSWHAVVSLVSVLHWAIVCGAVLMWLWAATGAKARTFGLSGARLGKSAGLGLVVLMAAQPLIIMTLLVGNRLYGWLVGTPAASHPVLESLGTEPRRVESVIFFLTAGVIIPFFEELFFRGILQTTLMRLGNAALAITITSALFGLAHLGVPTSVVPLMILGWALGYAFYRTGNLMSCFVMHSVFNLISLTLTALPQWLHNSQ